MSSPIVDAPYRPLPEVPSPVWSRAGRGLALMAVVALAQVPFSLAAGLINVVALDRVSAGSDFATVHPLLMAASAIQLVIHAGESIVTAYALAALAALPAWTRTRGLARASLALCVVAFARPFAVGVATSLTAGSSIGFGRASMLLAGVTFALDLALAAAITATLAVLLTRLTTVLAAPRPRGLWGLVAFGLALRVLGPVTTVLQSFGTRHRPPLALIALLVSAALWAAQSWGWARALRSVAHVVGAQSFPPSAEGLRAIGVNRRRPSPGG